MKRGVWRSGLMVVTLALTWIHPRVEAEEHTSAINRLKEEHLGVQPTIRVLVLKDAPSLLLEVQGRYRVYDPATGEYLSNGSNQKFMTRCLEDGVQWGEHFVGRFQFEIVPRSPSTTMFVNGIQYRGAISVYQAEDRLFVVNEVKLEDFLHSVLPPYLEGGPRGEALAAAAIVARTDLLAQTAARPNAIWHVDAKKVGYMGYAAAYQDPELDRAVDQTQGLVMTAGEANLPFRVCWEDLSSAPLAASALFDGAHTDGIAGSSKAKTQWSCSLPKAELARLANLHAVRAVASKVDPSSGRVSSLTVSDGKQSHDVALPTLQQQVGARRIRSGQFQVSLTGDHVRFTGRSEGNGMDLMAAQEMAEHGRDAASILRSFFPNARIQPWGD